MTKHVYSVRAVSRDTAIPGKEGKKEKVCVCVCVCVGVFRRKGTPTPPLPYSHTAALLSIPSKRPRNARTHAQYLVFESTAIQQFFFSLLHVALMVLAFSAYRTRSPVKAVILIVLHVGGSITVRVQLGRGTLCCGMGGGWVCGWVWPVFVRVQGSFFLKRGGLNIVLCMWRICAMLSFR